MKNTDLILAEKIKAKLVCLSIEDKLPLDLNDLDMPEILDQSRKQLLKDELYVRNLKLENLDKFVCASDTEDLVDMLEILENHSDKNEITGLIDGISMIERYETSFTVEELLEEITPVGA